MRTVKVAFRKDTSIEEIADALVRANASMDVKLQINDPKGVIELTFDVSDEDAEDELSDAKGFVEMTDGVEKTTTERKLLDSIVEIVSKPGTDEDRAEALIEAMDPKGLHYECFEDFVGWFGGSLDGEE